MGGVVPVLHAITRHKELPPAIAKAEPTFAGLKQNLATELVIPCEVVELREISIVVLAAVSVVPERDLATIAECNSLIINADNGENLFRLDRDFFSHHFRDGVIPHGNASVHNSSL